jgi:hypothetical protein
VKRPEHVTNEMLNFLDRLASQDRFGFGRTAALENQFNITAKQAAEVIAYWSSLRSAR